MESATLVIVIIVRAVDACRCNKSLYPESFEFNVQQNELEEIQNEFPYIGRETLLNTDQLKEKVICEFLHVLDQLECGI